MKKIIIIMLVIFLLVSAVSCTQALTDEEILARAEEITEERAAAAELTDEEILARAYVIMLEVMAEKGVDAEAAVEADTSAETEESAEAAETEAAQTDSTDTMASFGFEDGIYNDEENDIYISIETIESGDEADEIYMSFLLYEKEFGVKIFYPAETYRTHFGDAWYDYDPYTDTYPDPWIDIETELNAYTGQTDMTGIEPVLFVDDYFVENFGYKPENFIKLPME